MSKLYDRIGPFTTIPNSVIALWPKIGTDAMALFLFLRYRTNQETGDAFPSYDDIQEKTGLSRRRIARAIRALVDAGLLERKRRFNDSTIYTICAPAFSPLVAECDQGKAALSSTVQPPLVAQRATNKTKLTRTNTEEDKDTDCATAPATVPIPAPGKKSRTSPTDKPARKPKQPAPANPNTGPIQAAFVACLPPAMQAGFDYAATGRKAKALAIMGILPGHIATYYKMLREQWNKSPKMRDKAITFFDLADYIMARAQNSTLAQITTAPDVPGVAASLADELFRETIARMDAAAAHEPTAGELEAARLADEWRRLADQLKLSMTLATFDNTFAGARIAAHDGAVMSIQIHDPLKREWADARLRPIVERVARGLFAQSLAVEFVGGAS